MKSNINTYRFLKPNSWAQKLGQQSGLEAFAESREGGKDHSESRAAKISSLETKRFWPGRDHCGGLIPTGIGQDQNSGDSQVGEQQLSTVLVQSITGSLLCARGWGGGVKGEGIMGGSFFYSGEAG